MLLDFSALGFAGKEIELFFEEAKVQVCMGSDFGDAANQFVRINLACPRSVLVQALERMKKVYEGKEV
jgi:cystathionine beta-lyase